MAKATAEQDSPAVDTRRPILEIHADLKAARARNLVIEPLIEKRRQEIVARQHRIDQAKLARSRALGHGIDPAEIADNPSYNIPEAVDWDYALTDERHKLIYTMVALEDELKAWPKAQRVALGVKD